MKDPASTIENETAKLNTDLINFGLSQAEMKVTDCIRGDLSVESGHPTGIDIGGFLALSGTGNSGRGS